MSSVRIDFEQLMERVRAGDAEAGKLLFERYGKAIQQIVRCRMDHRLRSQFDSLDFAQDAWASLFRVSGEALTFHTPEELVAFLTSTVQHKVVDAYRKNTRTSTKKKRRRYRCVRKNLNKQLSRQPSPSQCAVAEEEWDRMIQDKPPKVQQALTMLREGYSQREIAEHLGLNARRIHRLLARLKQLRSP